MLIYDFMPLMVPEEKRDLWKQYHNDDGTKARVEYEALAKIRRGETADALLYKDYGPDWPYLKDVPIPKFWIPQAVPEDMYQDPPPEDVWESFLYVGTIVPKCTHRRPANVFEDIMLEGIFDEVSRQGIPIHAYVLNPHPDVIQEYKQLFPDGRVRLFRGDVTQLLVPRVAGRYRWGWALYHYPEPMVMPLVKTTLPTKLFTYLAIGIPIVVSAEMKATCRIVKQYNCGVIVTQEEIPRVAEILRKADYKALQEGVLRARKELSLDRFIPKLGSFLKRIMKSPAKRLEPYDEQQSHEIQRIIPPATYLRPSAAFPGREGDLSEEPTNAVENGPD